MSASNPNLNDIFTDIANAIREKDGSSDEIHPVNFADKIIAIPSGGQEYEGPYTITENIVLPVAGLRMTQDLVINVSGGGASYALVDNEYGKTIVFMANYASMQNDYGTTLII